MNFKWKKYEKKNNPKNNFCCFSFSFLFFRGSKMCIALVYLWTFQCLIPSISGVSKHLIWDTKLDGAKECREDSSSVGRCCSTRDKNKTQQEHCSTFHGATTSWAENENKYNKNAKNKSRQENGRHNEGGVEWRAKDLEISKRQKIVIIVLLNVADVALIRHKH